uniref:RB1-inducible coiled-coil protein 1 n=1 Tax=Salmo trutta TaxID=8032 RepID=A0A673XBI5_SALTR
MKLYVFQVNNGSTLTFDTELAVQTVLDLKHAIQVKYKIATQHQVLVVNGGECMVAERRVCSYSAGTDTNPIFLFNKEMILCDRAPTITKTTFSIENEMELKVEESLMMPAVFHTVASRTQLAVEMFEVAKKLCSFCERLVHDEHLQHQGWAAIMANLDDCTLSYQKLLWKFDTAYMNYQQDFEDIKLKLTKLGTAVSVMAKIPLLECLTRHSYRECLEKSCSTPAKNSHETEEEKSTDSVLCPTPTETQRSSTKLPLSVCAPGAGGSPDPAQAQESSEMTDSSELRAALQEADSPERANPPSFNVTLLDWINVQDRPNDVESVVRKCFDSINRLDPRIIQPFLSECRDTIAKLDNQNMKAIKGLEDRLYALDQMIASCNKLVNEQKELAQGFLANQKRAENLKDTSVLPDLCLSHANQLMIMLTNHRKLLDIKQKCTTAKQELANNLQVRLKWCCYVMLHADQDGEKLQALLRLLTELMERVRVVDALSTVPQMYCLAVVEVVRRKIFIGHYREWACALVKDGKRLYETEKYKRETFGKLFRKSFLRNRLFRGLDSWPPTSFCTRKPRKFDFELPDISLGDLQYLKTCCPTEVQPFLRLPTLCDFEPLHQHVEMLQQLVLATQAASVDEMSRTITDLLSEQRRSTAAVTPLTTWSNSTPGTTFTSSVTPSSLSLPGPLCQPLPGHGPTTLEDLSPDSIDAQTFDFETIGHPNMDPVLQQAGSLDLDSLAESPESDFMSAVNEFVIENPPTPISDPTSPGMMVESLYSSVINAIDSKRMHDTTALERENSKMAALKLSMEKYRTAAEESQTNLRSVKDDLYRHRDLLLKEQRDFGFALKTMTSEVCNMVDTIRNREKEQHQAELLSLQQDHENQLQALMEENQRDCQLMDLEARVIELADLRCKLEVELALKESETEEVRLLYEEAKQGQQEANVGKATVEAETQSLSEQLAQVNRQLQAKNEEYETGLAELRRLMRMEKDQCISELADRHEEERNQLHRELTALQQQTLDTERSRVEQLQNLQRDLDLQTAALCEDKEKQRGISEEQEQHLRTVICDLQVENDLLAKRIEQDTQTAQERLEKEKALKAAVPDDFKDLKEAGLSEVQTEGRGSDAGAPLSLDSALQEHLQQETASLHTQLELLERRKNEEMQNLKTSLIAEQQTNFNTVLTREKLKKEQIINDLTEKLRKVTQQQEKDKGTGQTDTMSSVSSRHSEKIAIRDFQVGDLVLIILDERHDNYVLFTVGPTLYFLHSESLTALDLKPASGASRRPWVLGKVMEKEYCQAKKAQNRFKVPLGTKFYRVKAVSWNKKV